MTLSLIFISGCRDNNTTDSDIDVRETDNIKLNNCLHGCERIGGMHNTECTDLCYFEFAQLSNNKNLCNSIADRELRANCLIN